MFTSASIKEFVAENDVPKKMYETELQFRLFILSSPEPEPTRSSILFSSSRNDLSFFFLSLETLSTILSLSFFLSRNSLFVSLEHARISWDFLLSFPWNSFNNSLSRISRNDRSLCAFWVQLFYTSLSYVFFCCVSMRNLRSFLALIFNSSFSPLRRWSNYRRWTCGISSSTVSMQFISLPSKRR